MTRDIESLLDWDDEPTATAGTEPETTEADEPETPDEPDEPDTPDEPDESESEEEETEETAEEEQPEGDEAEEGAEPTDEEVEAAYASDDPEVQAFLKRYQGDPEKALRGAVQLQRAMGRQGQEKAVLSRKVAELERELAQAQAFSAGRPLLNDAQREWVDGAVESGNPAVFVKAAVDEGQYELARAVCSVWAQDDTFSAMRAAQAVDLAELHADTERVESQPLETGELLGILSEHYPDLPEYQQQMAGLIETMGHAHPLVEDARSSDPQTAARGIIGLYEVARAQSTRLSTAHEQVKTRKRADATAARAKAQVSSAGATPSPGETPRPVRVTPGLTLEQLDAEWGRDY